MKLRSLCWLTLGLLLFSSAHLNASASELTVASLRVENQADPLGVDISAPRLSWQLESSRRGDQQTAYQILAATSADDLAEGKADLWDSGKVASNESIQIAYRGKPLRSSQPVFWKVRVWDRDGKASHFSKVGRFEMGMLSDSDWRGSWITRPSHLSATEAALFKDDPAPLFRKAFATEQGRKINRARIYVSGLGYYELSLNGERVGDHVLDPGWTSYSKRVLYSTYDVTKQVRSGQNVVGLMLGNGWFNPLPLRLWGHINLRDNLTIGEPRAICQLLIEYADGSKQIVASDASWKTGDGPILRNNIYLGEIYDARKEIAGWDALGFDDSSWANASVAGEPRLGALHAQSAPPIRITRKMPAAKLTEPKPGVFIFDFGQNFAGWARLHVKGPSGSRVRLRFGELLYPDGALNAMTSVHGQIKAGGKDYRYDGVGLPKTAFQQDEYILKGGGEEIYTPRFTFHGFRYVEVTGFPGKPDLHALEGLRLNSDVMPVGSFECSNPLFNRIQEMVLWTELSNLFSVQSDCPHRERFGYGGDILVSGEMAMLNFDMSNFYEKAARDLADAVRTNGGFTETAPFVGISDEGFGAGSGPVEWGSGEPFLLLQLYRYYGNKQLLEEQFEATKRWIALLRSRTPDGILDNGLSDHEGLVPKPRALTGTAFNYLNEKLYSRIAGILGHQAEAQEAEHEAEKIKAAFNNKFLKPGSGQYDSGAQVCQAAALALGLVPQDETSNALRYLTNDIASRKGHLSTGIFGTKFLLQTLSERGREDVAYEIVNQRTFPGWGYMLENGATTLWEHWEGSDNTYSHNHPMFGSVSEWFYKVIGGISPAPDAVGFNKIIIKPRIVGDLKWAKAHYDSVHGRIATEWRRSGDNLELRVTVPVGATARVFVPAKAIGDVREGGREIGKAQGVESVGYENGAAEFSLGSGTYRFTSTL